MATLTVWKFDSPVDVRAATSTLLRLPEDRLADIHDTATLRWPDGKRQPAAQEASILPTAAPLGAAFWGLLFGLLFYVPLLGSAIGAAAIELDGVFNEVGISDELLAWSRRTIVAGTSALFVLSSDALHDVMKQALQQALTDSHPEMMYSTLTSAQEDQLHQVFAVD